MIWLGKLQVREDVSKPIWITLITISSPYCVFLGEEVVVVGVKLSHVLCKLVHRNNTSYFQSGDSLKGSHLKSTQKTCINTLLVYGLPAY